MTLKDLKPGEEGMVKSIGEKGVIRRRLMDMGITPGVKIKLIKVAPLGDPMEVLIRGYSLSLRKSEANRIEIEM